jgi:hypothetical protein
MGLVPGLRAALLPLRNATKHQVERMARLLSEAKGWGSRDAPGGLARLRHRECTGCLEPLKPDPVACGSCGVAAFCSARCLEDGPFSKLHARVCAAALEGIAAACCDEAAAAMQRLRQPDNLRQLQGLRDAGEGQGLLAGMTLLLEEVEAVMGSLNERLEWPYGCTPSAAEDRAITLTYTREPSADGGDGSDSDSTHFGSADSSNTSSDAACESCEEG